jgi:hypothetical protein
MHWTCAQISPAEQSAEVRQPPTQLPPLSQDTQT